MQRLRVDGVVYRPIHPDAALLAPLNLAYRRGDSAAVTRRFIELVRRSPGCAV